MISEPMTSLLIALTTPSFRPPPLGLGLNAVTRAEEKGWILTYGDVLREKLERKSTQDASCICAPLSAIFLGNG